MWAKQWQTLQRQLKSRGPCFLRIFLFGCFSVCGFVVGFFSCFKGFFWDLGGILIKAKSNPVLALLEAEGACQDTDLPSPGAKFDRKRPVGCRRFQQNSWNQIGTERPNPPQNKTPKQTETNQPKNPNNNKWTEKHHWVRSCSCELIKHWEIYESVIDWLDICPRFWKSFNWSSQFTSLQSQSALWNKLMGGQLYGALLVTELLWFFFFVSCWLNTKLKGKRLISCRNSYEACVLPGISPAVLSFPCVKDECCMLETGRKLKH